jgi:hypothetical protein
MSIANFDGDCRSTGDDEPLWPQWLDDMRNAASLVRYLHDGEECLALPLIECQQIPTYSIGHICRVVTSQEGTFEIPGENL